MYKLISKDLFKNYGNHSIIQIYDDFIFNYFNLTKAIIFLYHVLTIIKNLMKIF